MGGSYALKRRAVCSKRSEYTGIDNMEIQDSSEQRGTNTNQNNIDMNNTNPKEIVSLLRRCSNNLNQYAKRANETGSIYEADIKDLQARFDEIWGVGKEILLRLSSIQ